jgi:integrase
MPRKYQNPKLQVRADVKRPYYFIRAAVTRIDDASGMRRRVRPELQIGFVDEITAKQARERRAEILEILNQGRFIAQSQIRFKEVIQRYIDGALPLLGVATQAQQLSQIRNHLLPAFGQMQMCEIDKPMIQQFMAAKAETLGWWSRNSLRSILSGIFKAAKDWKLWDGDNPVLGVRIGKKKFAREKRMLAVADLLRLLEAVEDNLRFLIMLLFSLGLRISEALGLKWTDFDFDQAKVTIGRRWYRGDLSGEGETKTETSNAEIRISPMLMAEIRRRYPGPEAGGKFIFTGPDGVSPDDDRDLLRYRLRPILERLGLYYPGFGWHAFRRQNITWKQQLGGATLIEAQKAGRHASLDMTYLYTLTDHERETLQQERMMQAIFGQGVKTDKVQ